MKGYEELSFMDATALADLIKKKKIQAKELLEVTIEKIEKMNPRINAVVTPMYEEAKKAVSENIPAGPFAGVPFLIKDLIASYKGVRMTCGTKNMKNFIADHDSELVSRYKKAGFIILGKTNTPELGLMPTTESRFLGPCRNPWDLNRTSGGSSGGSAAAVASGMVSVAHGNDGAGSIRIPASCCGVFGLKPTRGRNPLGPDFGDLMRGLVAEHVLARSVRDSAAILDATAGSDIGDPYFAPQPLKPFRKEIEKNPGRLHIAFWSKTLRGDTIAEDCQKSLWDAVQLCSDLGHDFVEIKPDLDAQLMGRALTTIWASYCVLSIEDIARLTGKKPSPDDYEPVTWGLYEIGKNISGADYLLAVQNIQKIARQTGRFFLNYDLFMTSTLGEPPVVLGSFDSPAGDLLKGWRRGGRFSPYTFFCNITRHPGMSVPLYWNDDKLPIGTHFMGRYGDEATLFRLASQLEEARPWIHRRPQISDFRR